MQSVRGSCLDEANKQYDITRQINDINRSTAAQEQALINSINSERAGANMDMLRYYNDMDYNYDVLAADNYNKAEDRVIDYRNMEINQQNADTSADNIAIMADENEWRKQLENKRLNQDHMEFLDSLAEEVRVNDANIKESEARIADMLEQQGFDKKLADATAELYLSQKGYYDRR